MDGMVPISSRKKNWDLMRATGSAGKAEATGRMISAPIRKYAGRSAGSQKARHQRQAVELADDAEGLAPAGGMGNASGDEVPSGIDGEEDSSGDRGADGSKNEGERSSGDDGADENDDGREGSSGGRGSESGESGEEIDEDDGDVEDDNDAVF